MGWSLAAKMGLGFRVQGSVLVAVHNLGMSCLCVFLQISARLVRDMPCTTRKGECSELYLHGYPG